MSSQRLSRLQRFILAAALDNLDLDEFRIPRHDRIYEGFWGKVKVWTRYCDVYDMRGGRTGRYKFNHIGSQFRVSLSRSFKGLQAKGLIQSGKYGRVLTDQGKATALMLTSAYVNNKATHPAGHREEGIHATD